MRRYTPSGALDRIIHFPVSTVTSCTFGGADLDLLFVTSACVGRSEVELHKEPHSGAVFVCEVSVAGLPASRFAG